MLSPHQLAIDSSGYIYVADNANSRIQVFDSNGNFITKFGEEGNGTGQMKFVSGVALDSSGNVYVTDTDNRRILKFSKD